MRLEVGSMLVGSLDDTARTCQALFERSEQDANKARSLRASRLEGYGNVL